MRSHTFHRRAWLAILPAALSVAFVLSSCGDETPAAPPAPMANITLSTASLDFGVACGPSTRTRSFVVRAPAGNTEPVSGTVAESNILLTLTRGAGDYTLDPGDSLVVEASVSTTGAATLDADITVGHGKSVHAYGGGREYPKLYVGALQNGGFSLWDNSDLGNWYFSGDFSYSNPSWSNCATGFFFDGVPVVEKKGNFTGVKVPAGVSSLLVTVTIDASSSCAQLLIELEGNRETVKTSLPTSCTQKSYRISWPFPTAKTTTISIGTDDQSITCFADIVISSIWLTFEGACPGAVADGAPVAGFGDVPVFETGEIEELTWQVQE